MKIRWNMIISSFLFWSLIFDIPRFCFSVIRNTFVMNGMCDLSAHLKSGFMCMTLGLWNPKGCNYVESFHEEL